MRTDIHKRTDSEDMDLVVHSSSGLMGRDRLLDESLSKSSPVKSDKRKAGHEEN
jgi:hypothetical protein